jgi:hypothetical protein
MFIKNWIKGIKVKLNWLKGKLGVYSQNSNRYVRFMRCLKLTASRYGSAIENNGLKILLCIIQKIATVFIVLFIFFPCFTSLKPVIGLFLSIAIFLFLFVEFILFRPKIFVIFELPAGKIYSILHGYYPTSMTHLKAENPIRSWKRFFADKRHIALRLRNNLISSDNLRLICIIKIFLRALVLLAWYSVIIMYADKFSGGQILDMTGVQNHVFSFFDYLYQEFSLFLSVSSISVPTSTPGGTFILLGQIIIYFTVLVVAIGRIADNMSMYSSKIEDIAQNAVEEYLEL